MRGGGEGAAGGLEPLGAGEGGQVGGAGAQIVDGPGGARGRGGSAGGAVTGRSATRVPEPWRAVSQPSATRSA